MGKSLLELADRVSNRVLGIAAQVTDIMPNKAFIIDMINESYKSMCNRHKDWTWLDMMVAIDGFDLDLTTSDVIPFSTGLNRSVTIGYTSTGQIAEKISITRDAAKVNTADFKVSINTPVLVNATGFIRAYLYADNGGSPGAAINTSNSVAIVDNVVTGFGTLDPTGPLDVSFTFTNPTVVSKGTYWLGLEYEPSPVNNFAIIPTTATAVSTGTTFYRDGTAAFADAGHSLYVDYNVTYGTIATTLTTPIGYPIQLIYSLNSSLDANNSVALTYTPNSRDGNSLIGGQFRILRVNSDGTITFEVPAGFSNIYWYADCKVKRTVLSADADEPLTPEEFDDMLVWDAARRLFDLKYGINSEVNSKVLQVDHDREMSNMEKYYRNMPDHVMVEVRGQSVFSTGDYATKPRNSNRGRGRGPSFGNMVR